MVKINICQNYSENKNSTGGTGHPQTSMNYFIWVRSIMGYSLLIVKLQSRLISGVDFFFLLT